MNIVTLSDLKHMGKLGGYTIRLKRQIPFSYTNSTLRQDCIEFTRVGVVDGEKKEITLRETYGRVMLEAIDTIMVNKTLVARRMPAGHLQLTGRGYRRVDRTTG
ncbi:TPA: hypothetical protein ACGO1G_000110 [Streptococcus suis]